MTGTWPAATGAAPSKDQLTGWLKGLFGGSTTGTTGSSTKANPNRVAVAAAGARAPLCYGRVQVAGKLAAAKLSGSTLYLLFVWCEGEIEAIEGLVANGTDGVTYTRTDYRGTSNQGADPWLAAAISGYADTLRGTHGGRTVRLAYSVLKVTSGQPFPTSPRAIVKGLKLYDPRTGQTTWKSNPALILADLLTRAGETVDWSGSVPAFDLCDEVVSGSPRWTASLTIDSPSSIYDHAERLRAYAHCMIAHGPAGIRLIPDGPVSQGDWINLGASQIVQGSLKLSRRPYRDTPTCVRVTYTNAAPSGQANAPWGQASVAAYLDGAGSTLPWIESGLSLDGIQSYQEAYRAAQQRLYGLAFRNLLAECLVRDEGLRLLPGDVVSMTHPIGLAAKPMRVLDARIEAPGRYRVQLEEYDPGVYSSAAPTAPTYPDTSLPSPLDVPAPTGLTHVIETYTQADGTYATRLRLSWDAQAYPYGKRYELQVLQDGVSIWSASLDTAECVTPSLQTGRSYTWRVRLLAAIGVTGDWASASVTVPTPNYRPTDIAKLSGVEIGGEVRLAWTSAIDTDIWRYEIRWGATTGTWDEATLLDRVDSLRLSARDIPEGHWKFWAKAVDSVGQYSANAASVTLTVTRDARAFFVGEHLFQPDAATNAFVDTDRYGVTRAFSEGDSTVNQVFASLASSYDQPVIYYGVPAAPVLDPVMN